MKKRIIWHNNDINCDDLFDDLFQKIQKRMLEDILASETKRILGHARKNMFSSEWYRIHKYIEENEVHYSFISRIQNFLNENEHLRKMSLYQITACIMEEPDAWKKYIPIYNCSERRERIAKIMAFYLILLIYYMNCCDSKLDVVDLFAKNHPVSNIICFNKDNIHFQVNHLGRSLVNYNIFILIPDQNHIDFFSYYLSSFIRWIENEVCTNDNMRKRLLCGYNYILTDIPFKSSSVNAKLPRKTCNKTTGDSPIELKNLITTNIKFEVENYYQFFSKFENKIFKDKIFMNNPYKDIDRGKNCVK